MWESEVQIKLSNTDILWDIINDFIEQNDITAWDMAALLEIIKFKLLYKCEQLERGEDGEWIKDR